jgi:alpha-ribazole phosphatase
MTPAVTRWWLVRHAPAAGPAGIIHGQDDIACEVDAAALRQLAAILPAGAVWLATPLRRSRHTADMLLALGGHDFAPEIEAGLVEQHFGAWQGLRHDDLADDAEAAAFWRDPAAARPPGGESFLDVAARVAEALARRSRRHAGRDIVAVCHAGTVRAALAHALGMPPERALAFEVAPLSLTRVDRLDPADGPPAWRVGCVNRAVG